jgi:hypothetical protein
MKNFPKIIFITTSYIEFIQTEQGIVCGNSLPTVEKVNLSATEIIIGCNNAENKSCEDSEGKISVETIAIDPDGDVITYSYVVSGGEIVGSGSKVIWDLSNIVPGTYTITVGASDGCGICNPTKTETVIIKECSDCSPK